MYYVCVLTIPNRRYCPDEKVFDLSVGGCVPGNQETCEIFGTEVPTSESPTEEPTTRPPTTEPPTEAPTTEPPTEVPSTRTWSITAPTVPSIPTIPTQPTRSTTEATTEAETEATTESTRSTRSRTTRTTTKRSTTTRTTATPPTETPRPPTLDEICEGVFFGARAYEADSQLFVGCIRGEGLIFTCYPSEYFDSSINECAEVQN